MALRIVKQNILFEVSDYAGTAVRTTKAYWEKIKTEKHRELTIGYEAVIRTIQEPDEAYKSVHDEFIKLFYRKIGNTFLVVVVKYVGTAGFVVTCYETGKTKRKGEKLWPK